MLLSRWGGLGYGKSLAWLTPQSTFLLPPTDFHPIPSFSIYFPLSSHHYVGFIWMVWPLVTSSGDTTWRLKGVAAVGWVGTWWDIIVTFVDADCICRWVRLGWAMVRHCCYTIKQMQMWSVSLGWVGWLGWDIIVTQVEPDVVLVDHAEIWSFCKNISK